jgi:hypothetical protein
MINEQNYPLPEADTSLEKKEAKNIRNGPIY